ncbi:MULTISPECIES: DNA polymerase I [Bifidobacterium]|jgi:DNA polymerase-1|uniref:DNA polymerase I n=1 Tax=Bifidobacterium TaxID=1678 RepID=UPI000E44FE39|nr:DNA polymerase I [Bifidobacterium longum]MDU2273062.1 DNA polymerase I [Bifidobacterium longum]MDU3639473.1 DNA polymerase I [Bifidobacterium longum]QLE14865.1 DNA polymerase I [Bifidobacterium longum subsp. longum]RGN24511.1 DNA polymerase I [Bifidobacterium longum]TBR83030.1 DNA polymerase I [Bifidobacterium longum subsp. longum]
MGEASVTVPTNETLLVVDGHSLAFRAFFALPVDNFSTSSGQATNAVWGFATMLAQVIDAEKPDHLGVAFDVKGGTFRNEMLPQYKGTREAAPEELLTQLPLIQRMLTALGVTYIEKPGFEGDDVIATLATMGDKAGYHTLVLSGDRDAFQLVDDNVTVLYPGHHFKDLKHMTPQSIIDKYKVTPAQYPDLAALRGETADNIPGVPGVGDGFAAKWINQFGSLDGICEHADEIGGKKGESLRANIDQVKLNRKVNALVRDVDLGVDIEDLTFGTVDVAQIDALFKELEFGPRTKSRVLKTFNTGAKASNTSGAGESTNNEQNEQDSSLDLNLPEPTSITAPEQFDEWVKAHRVEVKVPGEIADFTVSDYGDGSQRHAICGDAVGHAWTVAAWGDERPGRATAQAIAVATATSAAIVPLPITDTLRAQLAQFLKSEHSRTIVHGYKELLHLLGAVDLDMDLPMFDTKLAGYLAQPDFHADSLKQAAEHFLDIHFTETEQPSQGTLDFDDDQVEEDPNEHRLRDLAIIRSLAVTLGPIIDEREQCWLMRAIELPVSRVLHGMEHTGAKVDSVRLVSMRDQFAAEARQAQEMAWEYAGTEINLQSPKQLQKVLFEDMGLKPTKRTKSGSYTTNAAALQDLYVKSVDNERANGFLGALLRHREINKLKQIVQTLIDATNTSDERIHTTFEQTVAATGRLSSVDPNLQNIPNRNAAGREIRGVFVPGEGYEALMSCDYSQVELRIMADLSDDEALIEAFRSGADFHKYVASMVYKLPVDQITGDQRSHVKAMSYGLAYGLSTYGLAQQLKIAPREAEALKNRYFDTFGKVHDYLESLVANAREKGYTETIFGRRRYFPALHSTNRVAREAAERAALNAPIQGSAADIMKIAMIRAEQTLAEAHVKSRIILQIHDELVVEIAPGEGDQVTELVRNAMEHAVDLAVPLDVSCGIGSDWQLAAH